MSQLCTSLESSLEGCLVNSGIHQRSPSKELLYKNYEHVWIEVFSYSSYVGDKRDRKSTYDYCTYIGQVVSYLEE